MRSFALCISKLNEMKKFNILLAILLVFTACKDAKKESENPAEATLAYTTAGAPVSEGDVLSETEIDRTYAGLQPGDTLTTRFEGEVESVCQMKGCWMRLQLPGDETVMVRFKDYGFFVPKDIAGKRVLVEGKAFVSEVDEEERRHMAEDAGKPDSLITQITGSAMQKGFEATGVRIFE